jgi:hypothetical protein
MALAAALPLGFSQAWDTLAGLAAAWLLQQIITLTSAAAALAAAAAARQ